MIQLPNNRGPIVLKYPLAGRFRARNSPARRVPSHGTDLMGTTFAIDFIPVDLHGRSAAWNWRAVVATERPETFVGFGAAVVAPSTGTVVITQRKGPKVVGTLREETTTHVVVMEGTPPVERRIAKSDITERSNPVSAMPPFGAILKLKELRDIVEFLSMLKGSGADK